MVFEINSVFKFKDGSCERLNWELKDPIGKITDNEGEVIEEIPLDIIDLKMELRKLFKKQKENGQIFTLEDNSGRLVIIDMSDVSRVFLTVEEKGE